MKIPFNPKNEITNKNDLFGRDVIFKQLVAIANRKSNTQLIGSRRFGKTSLFKSLEKYLKEYENSKVYPIYCDFKEVGEFVKGTANVYRYLISLIVSNLTKDEIFTDKEEFRNQYIIPSKLWEDVFISLEKINDIRIPGLFEEITTFFADLIEKTFLFLFDEYEFLFRFSFDKPVGFMKLRNFTSKLTDKGLNPFSFFVSGGITWEHLCSITGSGELNCIDQLLFVSPIDFESFKNMWENETKKINDCPTEIMNGVGYAYKASGGVPFYAKIIGSKWLMSNKKPDYSILKSHLQELYNSLENEQKHILKEIVNNKKTFKISEHLLDLKDKGIITKNKDKYSVSIGFFNEYIKKHIKENSKEATTTEIYTKKIEELIISINRTHNNKKGDYIFKPVNDDLILFRDLRIECLSSEQFAKFSSSLYHIMFERTKRNISGVDKTKVKLPNEFKRNNRFLELIDIMRHSLGRGHLMDTFTSRSGQMTKVQMLQILTGSKNEPVYPEDFYNLQINTLKMFEKELLKLKRIVDDM